MPRPQFILTLALLLAFFCPGLAAARTPATPKDEKNPAAPGETVAPGVIKSEAKMVLVDVIATDKKKN